MVRSLVGLDVQDVGSCNGPLQSSFKIVFMAVTFDVLSLWVVCRASLYPLPPCLERQLPSLESVSVHPR